MAENLAAVSTNEHTVDGNLLYGAVRKSRLRRKSRRRSSASSRAPAGMVPITWAAVLSSPCRCHQSISPSGQLVSSISFNSAHSSGRPLSSPCRYRTEQRTGVLIFAPVAERYAEIIADRRINVENQIGDLGQRHFDADFSDQGRAARRRLCCCR
jgi:hypothetical protein